MRVTELFAGEAVDVDGADVDVTSLCYDSRAVTAGALFAALPGANVDGHKFVSDALARGATVVLCEQPVDVGATTRVLVRDARATLARAAARFFDSPHKRMRTVGVTGTNGKTTTVYLIESVLRAAGLSPGVVGTLGTRYGDQHLEAKLTTPESVDLMATLRDMVAAGTNALAMEVSSHALSLHRVGGVEFNVGVFTNLSHDHLDFHGTMEAYFAAKSRLFTERLKPGGWRVLNYDDPWLRTLNEGRAITFSVAGSELSDIYLRSARVHSDGCAIRVATLTGDFEIHAPLLGGFNVENVMAALSTGIALGLDHQAIVKGIERVHAVPGRLERVSQQGEPLVLVDYAHTPDALEKALCAVREVTRGRLICVFGCGGDRDPRKRGPMGEVVGGLCDHAILTNDNPRTENPEAIASRVEEGLAAAGAVRGDGRTKKTYTVLLDREAAISLAIREADPTDAVLVAGKGHETYQIVGTDVRHFDDREQARAALVARSQNPGGDGHD